MKILQLCNKVPFPPKDGGCIAMNNLTQGLTDLGHQVKVIAINTPKHFTDVSKLSSNYIAKTNIETIFIDTHVKVIPAFLNLFSTKSYNIERFYSKTVEEKLIQLLRVEHFDIIQLESLYVSMYVEIIRENSKAKIILRAHNVEHQIWRQNAQITSNPLKKWYLNLLASRLKKYELNSLKTFDAIACITKEDETYFKKQNNTIIVDTFPFGIDLRNISTTSSQPIAQPSIFHIGAMDWLPNTEGVKWFLKNVWAKIHAQHPDVKFYLAGKNMPEWLSSLNMQNIIVKGEVADAYTFMNSGSIMIVPLLSGGGMRVKIIEGMALGKTIISTSIGAEGINYTNNKNIVIADHPIVFSEAISKCISDKLFCEQLGNNAKTLAQHEYNNVDICKRLNNFYDQVIKN